MQDTLEWLPPVGRPEQLLVLLHGVGGRPADMAPLARALRVEFTQAAVLAPPGFEPFDGAASPDARDVPDVLDAPDETGEARQWFSVQGIDDDNRPERVAAALPPLLHWVRLMQDRLRVPPVATALAGFSQGGILALEAASAADGLAGRVLIFSGRYARLPKAAPLYTTVHLFHGSADGVIDVAHARQALAHLGVLHGDATIDIAQGVGHTMHPALINCALQRLRTHIPMRTWQAALGAMPPMPPHPEDDRQDH